ncbi:hypothetical protein OHB12_05435 [Nocardia sp. NBC_01730]|uniref:hypothetical protein n=1 Tax=Nocardia sp. NBC_01730 TaxID=2975998 RepID=UPI002E0D3B0B|nr:hypothetical protein OHB12_05435 [Nocardia sp. NBC_01730]
MKTRSALGLVVMAAATALIGVAAPTATADDSALAADCAILGPIGSQAVGRLTPLQALPVEEGQAARDQYVGELQSKLSSVQSEKGKADLSNYINVVQTATSASDAGRIISAIRALQADCA